MSDRDYLKNLVKQMRTRFSLEGVEELTFGLNVPFDDLPGEGRTEKIRSLLKHLARVDRLPALLDELREERPNEEWPDLPENYRWETDELLTDDKSSTGVQKINTVSGSTITGSVFQGDVGKYIGGDVVNGDKVGGDKITVGDIGSRSTVAIGRGASATVSTNNHTSSIQYQIQKEIGALQKIVSEATELNKEEKESVKKISKMIGDEVSKKEPNKQILDISAEGLKQAAVNIGKALPAVVPIVGKIVQAVSRLLQS